MGILEAILDNVILMAFLGCFGGGIVFVIAYVLSKRLFDNSLDFSLLKSNLLESSEQKSISLESPFLESTSSKSNSQQSRVSNVIARFFKYPRFLLSLLAGVIFVLLSVFVIDFDMIFSLIFYPPSFFANVFEGVYQTHTFSIPLDFSLFLHTDFMADMVILSLFYVWICALFGLVFVLCAFDCRYFALLDSHNVAFLALCACKIFFVMLFGFFNANKEIAEIEAIEVIFGGVIKDILLGAGLLCLPLLLGKIFLGKEILGEGDIIFCAGFSGLFGFYFLSLSIFWGCVLASVGFIVVFIYAKISLKFFESKSQKQAKSPTYPQIFMRIPFVPFIVLGGFVTICLDFFT